MNLDLKAIVLQTVLLLALAPLVTGVIKKWKARTCYEEQGYK